MRRKDEVIRELEELVPDPVTDENLPVFHALCEAVRCVEIVREIESINGDNQNRSREKRYTAGTVLGIVAGVLGEGFREAFILALFAAALAIVHDLIF